MLESVSSKWTVLVISYQFLPQSHATTSLWSRQMKQQQIKNNIFFVHNSNSSISVTYYFNFIKKSNPPLIGLDGLQVNISLNCSRPCCLSLVELKNEFKPFKQILFWKRETVLFTNIFHKKSSNFMTCNNIIVKLRHSGVIIITLWSFSMVPLLANIDFTNVLNVCSRNIFRPLYSYLRSRRLIILCTFFTFCWTLPEFSMNKLRKSLDRAHGLVLAVTKIWVGESYFNVQLWWCRWLSICFHFKY